MAPVNKKPGSSSNLLRNTIIKVFSTKYALTLPNASLLFIEKVLEEFEGNQEKWIVGLDLWAKEYLRGEDPSPLVSLKALKEAYVSLSETSDADEIHATDTYNAQHPNTSTGPSSSSSANFSASHDLNITDVHVDSHFKIVDSFSMPPWRFDGVHGNFKLAAKPGGRGAAGIAGAAESRAAFLRERWAIIRQIILRNENFTPPAVGGRDRGEYLKLTSTRNLLGRQGQLFLLFGMLSRNPEGRLCLEDGEGKVVLDMEDAVPGEGLFTEGCMVLIEGEYTVEETIRVLAMGHPPSEKRDQARGIFGHVDFLGIGALSLKDDEKFRPIVDAHEDVSFVIISDLWLDHPKTLPALRRVFEGYSMTDFRPYAFIFCGNFSVKGWEGASSIPSYTAGFKNLADLIASFPTLASHSNFLFLPGPTDPWSSATLPRPAIPDNFTKYLRDKVPKVTFTSNPARIRYFGQEIVLFREDLMGRMLRNLVSVKDQTEGSDMKRYLVQSVLDQIHLSPLPLNIRPTIWEYDHALRLYPMPSAVILADKYERYDLTYEGCHVFNPGSFVGNHFEWSVYYPSTGRSESSALPDEE